MTHTNLYSNMGGIGIILTHVLNSLSNITVLHYPIIISPFRYI